MNGNDVPSVGRKYCSREELKQVIINSYDAILVTDGNGIVILCNPATGRLLDVEPQELVGWHVEDLINNGIYDRSVAYEALQSCKTVTGMLRNRHGEKIMATATPIVGKDGKVSIVVVNSRDIGIIEKYLEALDKESKKADRYKTAAGYLSEKDLKQDVVIAKSEIMKDIIEQCTLVAKSDSTVMLSGESGTGKEVMARFIHRNSPRAGEPFIPVNCAAIPAELLESEFFGYAAGAFTGASSRGKAGLLEIAHKGTLFLDEIGDLPLAMQAKLLRVIETGEVQRLGSTSIFKTDIRLVCATNKDLGDMVKKGLFRSDLYYRINVIPITLPPLRERPEDIPVLAEKFLEEYNRKYACQKSLPAGAIHSLVKYEWPGNVRELRNVIERLVVTSVGNKLDVENKLDFKDDVPLLAGETEAEEMPAESSAYRGTLKDYLKKAEEQYINQVLAECDGRIGEAAKRLGIHRTMLYRKKKQHSSMLS